MHAVILAGGKGVRLRPYTTSIPKPLVPIGDEHSILEIVLLQLAARGFTSITLAIGHFGHLIRSFVGDGSRWGLTVDYVEEEAPLGTIGPLLPVLDQLPEHFLVMNGDVLTDLPFDEVLRDHISSGAPLTVSTFDRRVHIDFGVLDVKDKAIFGFREKPTLPFRVSMGVYGMSRETLRRYPAGQPFGFDDLVLDLLERADPPHTFDFDGYWLDIGRPEDYDRANADFEVLRSALLPDPRALDETTTTSASTGVRGAAVRRTGGHRVLVLGGKGFLGRHVVEKLAERDDVDVTCLDRRADPSLAVPTIEMDVVEAGELALQRLIRGLEPTAVINCAGAITGDLNALSRANIGLVSTLVDAIAESGTGARLVHIGSSAEYGAGTPGTPIAESAVSRPTSGYAVTKLAGTETVLSAAAAGRLGGVVLRLFNPLGPGASAGSLTERVLGELDRVRSEGGPVRLGPLDAARDFIDVRDVVTAIIRAATLPGDLSGVFNIGRGRAVTARRFVNLLCAESGYVGDIFEREHGSDRSAHVDWQCADITRSSVALGWHPEYDLADTVRHIVAARVPV